MVLHGVMLLHGHELCLLAGLHALNGRQRRYLSGVTVEVPFAAVPRPRVQGRAFASRQDVLGMLRSIVKSVQFGRILVVMLEAVKRLVCSVGRVVVVVVF